MATTSRLTQDTASDSTALYERPSSYQRLAELAIGARIAIALRVVAERNIADQLANDRLSIDTLSERAGIPASSLLRLMRALAEVGVFAEHSDGTFSNTEASAYLQSDAPVSLRGMVVTLNDPAFLRAWQLLPTVLQNGQTSFAAANGMPLFDYIAADPERSQMFARMMTGVYGPEIGKIAEGYPFGRFASLMDVGGGPGHLLAEILKRYPHTSGALLDLDRTAEVARAYLERAQLGERSQIFSGDFFVGVPHGCQAYILKSILHDWDDDSSVRILRNCREALPREGRVLVIEAVVTPGKGLGNPHALVDLEMMVSAGGKERTADEYGALLQAAGLQLEDVARVPGSFFCVLEAVRV